jgi:hypothetical protein
VEDDEEATSVVDAATEAANPEEHINSARVAMLGDQRSRTSEVGATDPGIRRRELRLSASSPRPARL